ncbi:iron-siderophore ABC transporter substrate-binding protein [Pseudoclavibacter helvolus]|uniref:Iron complex transport system substrate-binding protein n=1 Tax=Pseudoclavibacter helvolus TaxID=255205 RepID=A0A7W4YDB7_9MICO|nr:iron-siderophore ABC transporter substrate-binding protein [Pseudoclavibacter helvolus]MBB2956224.1 iron complex transport system substrate-binding protein [Pseudoclavibacter helvolus]
MPRASKLVALAATALLTAGLAACSTTPATDAPAGEASGDFTPITIEHALGTIEITEKPERIATVNWANQEVPLALGVVPVGMARADFGDDNGDGILPWVSEKLEELGGETPVLFDETDGVDFEAVADTNPDVILAAYSGLTQEDYNTLSEIAPVVAYPDTAWATSWRDMIRLNSQGMGLEAEGDALITELEGEIEATAAKYPAIQGKKTMFLTHVDETDLSQVSFYTTHDTRSAFFEDLGMAFPQSLIDASASTDQFSQTISAEQTDTLADVEIIVTYGGEDLVQTLQGDPVLSQIPAVANGSIVNLPGTEPLGTAANPTPLSISWILDDYVALLSQAADKA